MWDAHEVVYCAAKVHDGDEFVKEFAGFWANDMPTDDFACFGMAEDFDKPMGFSQDHGFAVVVKGIGRNAVGDILFAAFSFCEAHRRKLRIGEDHFGFESVVNALSFSSFNRVVTGYLALLNGDVYDFVESRTIARCINIGRAGTHVMIHENASTLDAYAGIFKRERLDGGHAPQSMEDHFCRGMVQFVPVAKVGNFGVVFGREFLQLRVGKDFHAFFSEASFNRTCEVFICAAENVIAALNECGARSQTAEKLCKFRCDRTAT